jgi:transposase InsO family protein
MQAVYYAARGNLRWFLRLHPQWSQNQLAHALGMSRSWVSKWIKRLQSAPPDDEQVLRGLSRAPKHPPERLDPQVIARILEIRDQPPEGLGRTPGPKAILYYLPRDESLQQAQVRLPRSTRTLHRILREQGRIFQRLPTFTDPIERPEPMQHWQLDFKDASTVPADPEGKQQHVVETLNVIDVGTSVLLAAHVAADFTAETALRAVAETFQQHGLPRAIRLDRDPRWVGAPQGSDFPSALLRCCRSLGISVLVCDPHHPQENAFIERYHRSYGQECLDRSRPTTVEQVRQVTETFVEHYNWQRPHQGLSCGNQPPRVAHPELPALPPVPDVVNADGWLRHWDGQHLVRLVNRHGSITVNLAHYYLSRSLAGQRVTVRIDGVNGELHLQHPQLRRSSFPLKGLQRQALPYQSYLELMIQEASRERRLLALQRRRAYQKGQDSP